MNEALHLYFIIIIFVIPIIVENPANAVHNRSRVRKIIMKRKEGKLNSRLTYTNIDTSVKVSRQTKKCNWLNVFSV